MSATAEVFWISSQIIQNLKINSEGTTAKEYLHKRGMLHWPGVTTLPEWWSLRDHSEPFFLFSFFFKGTVC